MNESHLKALKILASNPAVSQREISRRLNLSLGKVNYVLNALIEKGYVKMERFRKSGNKLSYMYVLTPTGIRKRMELTRKYLKLKMSEYETLTRDIDELKEEIEFMENGGTDRR